MDLNLEWENWNRKEEKKSVSKAHFHSQGDLKANSKNQKLKMNIPHRLQIAVQVA